MYNIGGEEKEVKFEEDKDDEEHLLPPPMIELSDMKSKRSSDGTIVSSSRLQRY